MAVNPQHSTPVRNTIADLMAGIITAITGGTAFIPGTNQKLKLYTGTPPVTASTSLSSNTAAATITTITGGAGSAGATTYTGSTADPSAVGGTVTFFRLYRTAAADTADVILQGTVGTSAADLIINNTVIAASATVSLTGTNTYTAAA